MYVLLLLVFITSVVEIDTTMYRIIVWKLRKT